MKKLFFTMMFAVVAMAGMSQTIGEAFYIYRNDGEFNAFFRDEVDSIAYSNYDTDSIYFDEAVMQVVYTQDSIYRIPLAAIDSVGFVQPETIYKQDAVQLTGSLFDYLISADSLTLTFDASIPSALMPKIGDKLVATELSEKLPYGFSGTVRQIQPVSFGIEVMCDSLALENAVERFYGVAELVTYRDGGRSRRYLPHRSVVEEHVMSANVDLPRIHLPLDLSGVIKPKDVYDIVGSARADITIDPVLTGRVTYIVDNRLGFSHYNIHAILDAETETNVEIAGSVTKGDFFELLFDKDVPMPWGYPLYIAFGPQFELSGELALGTTIYANFHHTSDITFYPAATPAIVIAPTLSHIINTEHHTTKMTYFDIDWAYIAARIEAKLYVKGRLGLPFGKHDVGWVGAEFEVGAKCNAELNVDFEALRNAERGTGLYETLKDSKVEAMPYWGAVGKIGAAKDRFEFKFLGRDDYSFWGKKWEWYLLPQFSNTEAIVNSNNSIEASANITNDCIIPYTVGFSLFDENDNRIGEPQWNSSKFWKRNSFKLPYTTTFHDLATDQKYKVYPTLRLFGFPVLASPSADVDMKFPVEFLNFYVSGSQSQRGAFINDGKTYDYRFDVWVTVKLNNKKGVEDWGYVYRDPDGNEKEISLMEFGSFKIDDRYAYFRNKAKSTVTLYGYVKYSNNDQKFYGEPTEYDLVCDPILCPDDNHPHMIDLGLPSGTKWACCDIGVSAPYEDGGKYAWGETEEKSDYTTSNYKFAQASADGKITVNGVKYNYIYIGEDICGTDYDVAYVKWGNSWRMPSVTEMEELVEQCTWRQGDKHWGYYIVTGPNGVSIALSIYPYWTGSLNHEASYWLFYTPIPYVLWPGPPRVHSPMLSSDFIGSHSPAESGCFVRAVHNVNSNLTRKKALSESSKPEHISRKAVENAIVVVKEETEKTGLVKRTYMKLESK